MKMSRKSTDEMRQNVILQGKRFSLFLLLLGWGYATSAQSNYTSYRDDSNHQTKNSNMTDVLAIDVDGSNDMEFITNTYRVNSTDYGFSFFTNGLENLRLWNAGTNDADNYMLFPNTTALLQVGVPDGNEEGYFTISSHAGANLTRLNLEANVTKMDGAVLLGNKEGGSTGIGDWNGSSYTSNPSGGTLIYDKNWSHNDPYYNTSKYFALGEDIPNVNDDDTYVGGLALYAANYGYYGDGGWEHVLTTHNMYLLKAKFYNVATRDVTVRPDGQFPDYVFDKDYKLMPLEEVEKYIEANHHLPNVISAEQAEKEGVSVAKLQESLLEKVEEMTLYLIQIKKENEELKKNVKELQQTISEIQNK